MDQKKLKIAYHETGHAVMAILYGQRIEKVSLREMDSPLGSGTYSAFMKPASVDPNIKLTGKSAIQKIMISLGGYASEILFYDGWFNTGQDDLTIAANNAESMMEMEEFKNWVAELPIPNSNPFLDTIKNPLIRAYINLKWNECITILARFKPVVKLIAEELYKSEELTGDEVYTLFDSFMQSRLDGKL